MLKKMLSKVGENTQRGRKKRVYIYVYMDYKTKGHKLITMMEMMMMGDDDAKADEHLTMQIAESATRPHKYHTLFLFIA